MAMAVWFALLASCAPSPARVPEGVRPPAKPQAVKLDELPGGRLKLSFKPVAPDPALEVLRREEARAALAAFQESFHLMERHRLRLVLASTGAGNDRSTEWESRLREEYLSRYGPSRLPLPQSLETSPLFMALKLSPRYMGAGVREAAQEMFSSPVFLSGVALSVLVYFAAWMAPEPIFSKAFVATLTARLALAVGVLELTRLAQACIRLYLEAEAARTVQELEAAAEHFGKAMGGTALRVLVLVASMGVAKELPQVPEGGLWKMLRLPRLSLPEGMTMEGTTEVRMVADGTVIVTGVAAGTVAAAVGSACTDGSEKKDGHQWHHLATNKNEISTLYGGPWTPRFEEIFAMAGMSLDASENLVYLAGHKGPHPEQYHEEIFRRLREAVTDCQSVSRCRERLVEELRKLADEVCTPGTLLHQLATSSQD
ncbi:MAG: AHH domain-containing protein [Archangium sp.]